MTCEFTLTDENMKAIADAIEADGEVAGLLVIWEAILGAPLADNELNINPNKYAIPAKQWEEIAGYMIFNNKRPLGIPGFSMVNQGPSSFEPSNESEGA